MLIAFPPVLLVAGHIAAGRPVTLEECRIGKEAPMPPTIGPTGAIPGATVRGADLARPLDDAAFAPVPRALVPAPAAA
jgi:hypothetical protein